MKYPSDTFTKHFSFKSKDFISFFTSSANTLLILRSSQNMAGLCVCDFCVLHRSDTGTLQSWGWNAMLAVLSWKKNPLPYSRTAVKFYKSRSSHQITWCKSYRPPAMGEQRRAPATSHGTSSVTGFCPLTTDYEFSVLESCLFTNVIEFPEIKKSIKL